MRTKKKKFLFGFVFCAKFGSSKDARGTIAHKATILERIENHKTTKGSAALELGLEPQAISRLVSVPNKAKLLEAKQLGMNLNKKRLRLGNFVVFVFISFCCLN